MQHPAISHAGEQFRGSRLRATGICSELHGRNSSRVLADVIADSADGAEVITATAHNATPSSVDATQGYCAKLALMASVLFMLIRNIAISAINRGGWTLADLAMATALALEIVRAEGPIVAVIDGGKPKHQEIPHGQEGNEVQTRAQNN